MKVNVNSSKYVRNAQAATPSYQEGVRAPKRSQSAAAIASEANYEAGVQASIANKRYSRGLQAAGDAKWLKGVTEKGQARYGQGVAAAGDEWQRGFQPFAQALGAIELTPRGPKGQNYGRVQQVGDALRQAKTGAA